MTEQTPDGPAVPAVGRSRASAARLIVVFVALAGAVVLGLLALSGYNAWSDLRRDVAREKRIYVDLLEEHASKIFSLVEQAFDQIGWMAADHGLAAFARDPALAERLRALAVQPEYESLWLADPAGNVVAQTLFPTPVRLDVSDREWFAVPARGAAGLHVAARVPGRISGQDFIPLSRRIEDEAGNLLGVAQVSLRPAYFNDFFRTLLTRPNTSVSLVRADGAVLAYRGAADDGLIAALQPGELFAGQPASGVAERTLPGGGARLLTYGRVGEMPVYVLIATDFADLRREWLQRMTGDASSTFAALLVLATLGFVAARKAREVDRLNRDLEDRIVARTRELQVSQRRLESIAANFPGVIFRLLARPDGTMRISYVSRAIVDLLGVTPEAALKARDLGALAPCLQADDLKRVVDAFVHDPTARTATTLEFRISPPGAAPRWLRCIARSSRATSGGTLWDGMLIDVSEQKSAERERERFLAHQQLLLAELNHRVKNTLATVHSMAMQTHRSTPDSAAFTRAFERRVLALARAHDLLVRSNWHAVPIRDVLAATLEPFGVGTARLRLEGGETEVPPQIATALSMAMHELATNAQKYGALSVPEGRVCITARETADGGGRAVELLWREEGGPPVQPAGRQGFGTRLLKRNLAIELDGEVTLAFDPAGVRCRIRFPLREERS